MKNQDYRIVENLKLPQGLVCGNGDAVRCRDNCMHPTIKRNSVVGFDPSDKELVLGHIYVFLVPQEGPHYQIRRFTDWVVQGEGVMLGTDHPCYLNMVQWLPNIEIVGKVKWIDNGNQLSKLLGGKGKDKKASDESEPARINRPLKFTKSELKKFSVNLIREKSYSVLTCRECNTGWGCLYDQSRILPEGYWYCPNNCNRETE